MSATTAERRVAFTEREAVLAALKEGPKTGDQLTLLACPMANRLKALRTMGHQIDVTKAAGKKHLYTLRPAP